MSRRGAPPEPPKSGKFRKGVSGNPKGRPKGSGAQRRSVFEILFDKTISVVENGKPRELTIDEALELRIYRDALAGNGAARRQVLKMIEAREKWLASRPIKRRPIEQLIEHDPLNAHKALLLLGIAERDSPWCQGNPYDRLLLSSWAVQAGLSRPGGRQLTAKDISEIKRCTRNPDTLRWPSGARNEDG
jgi:Family of unknown function (DUF5681)